MQKHCVGFLLFFLLVVTAAAQNKSPYSFRIGAQVAFGLYNIGDNNVGIGGLAGAERKFSRTFAVEAEASYTYFTGDKAYYEGGKNNAFALPILAGIKAYLAPQAYVSLRAGFAWFAVNDKDGSAFQPAAGIAGGINLPKKFNRVNVQLGYTRFGDDKIQRGFAHLATSIIIN